LTGSYNNKPITEARIYLLYIYICICILLYYIPTRRSPYNYIHCTSDRETTCQPVSRELTETHRLWYYILSYINIVIFIVLICIILGNFSGDLRLCVRTYNNYTCTCTRVYDSAAYMCIICHPMNIVRTKLQFERISLAVIIIMNIPTIIFK